MRPQPFAGNDKLNAMYMVVGCDGIAVFTFGGERSFYVTYAKLTERTIEQLETVLTR